MGWLSDELLFYGGIAVAACACVGAVIAACGAKIKIMRLNARLDEEYGPKVKRGGEK